MNEKEVKEKSIKLTELQTSIRKSIEEYNNLARAVDYTSRLALVTAHCDIYPEDHNVKTIAEVIAPYKTIHEYVMENYDAAYCSIGSGDGWISSQKGC